MLAGCLPSGLTAAASGAAGVALRRTVLRTERLGAAGPWNTLDPFLFCVYHRDDFPAGDSKMQAPRRGNGADFDPSAPYRMYHGDRIPGFPQHPHRGFETVTCTMQGLTDHSDSMGCAGRYGNGDLQWMTAGKGIVHGENFPLINQQAPNPLRLFQIWLNLPAKNKMVDPEFVMHWSENVPRVKSPDGQTEATVWAGTLLGATGLPPPRNSWASDPKNEVTIWHLRLQPKARFVLPPAQLGADANRRLYFFLGKSLKVADEAPYTVPTAITLAAENEVQLENPSDEVSEALLLGGRPIGEPVAQSGPFVMNTEAEIRQTYAEYRQTQFGGWPWEQDAVIFARDRGRFAQHGRGQPEELPPAAASSSSAAAVSPDVQC